MNGDQSTYRTVTVDDRAIDPTGPVDVLGPKLLRLVGQLRAAGVPVATSDVIDATAALAEIDLLDRAQVRAALGATLVKRSEDVRTFEILFGIQFAIRPDDRQIGAGSGPAGRQIATSLDRVGTGDGDADLELLDLIMDAVRRGDPRSDADPGRDVDRRLRWA